jgi:prephenate dehydrogenase
MQRVAIFGVGLIGGSFALALRRAGFAGEIVGVSSPRTIEAAIAAGVIERGTDAVTAAKECDLIYLSQPVLGILQAIEQYGSLFREDAIVTDAGSTKEQIAGAARTHVTRALFIGGHPMAGKERSGVQEAEAGLFEGRKYILTPLTKDAISSAQFRSFSKWIEGIGAHPVILDPAEHDRLVAYSSHLPQLLSTALASVLGEVEGVAGVTGPAALDMTRLAASPFSVWYDIFLTNRGNIEAALTKLASKFQELQLLVDSEALENEFERAREAARRLRAKELG